jgi:hypothetical protein
VKARSRRPRLPFAGNILHVRQAAVSLLFAALARGGTRRFTSVRRAGAVARAVSLLFAALARWHAPFHFCSPRWRGAGAVSLCSPAGGSAREHPARVIDVGARHACASDARVVTLWTT